MRIHQLSLEEALASLNTGPHGLAAVEAARRQREYGPNRIGQIRRGHPLLGLLKALTPFFSVVLWIAAGLAFLLDPSRSGDPRSTTGTAPHARHDPIPDPRRPASPRPGRAPGALPTFTTGSR